MYKQICVVGGELSPIWPPLIFKVVDELFLIVIVFYKLVPRYSKLL